MASIARYTHAIVCRVPNSFKTSAVGLTGEVDIELAKKQHEKFCRTLRDLGLDVIELPADESLPDCCFVDDTAVICNGTALICKPALPSRQREVDIIRTIIKKELELPIVEIADPKATIEGGDVLFTGREFFVGLSGRTNELGARALAAAFPEFPVTPLHLPNGVCHLSECMSMAGPDIISVHGGNEAQAVLKRMANEATFRYQTITVPDSEACNVLYVNGTLIHREEFPKSVEIFKEKIDYEKRELALSELSKAHGLLRCCCLLIKKSKYIKRL